MQLIPVIDLMAGQVVRGVRGERSAYRPIRSSLCESSAPLELAPRLLERAASEVAGAGERSQDVKRFACHVVIVQRLRGRAGARSR